MIVVRRGSGVNNTQPDVVVLVIRAVVVTVGYGNVVGTIVPQHRTCKCRGAPG